MDSKTIKVLSLDGGGIRGVINSTLLKLFCDFAEIPGDKIYEHFDIISGTSIGGIQALGYAKGLTPSYIQGLLKTNATTIFNCRAPGGGQAGYGTWSGYVSGIYESLYPQTPLKNLIDSQFGTDTIDSYKTSVLVPAFQTKKDGAQTDIPVYFSNIPTSIAPYLSGQTELAANIALATSAAPIYFRPAEFNNCVYVDGGIFLNNPSHLALMIEKAEKPTANRYCVLSIGTGRGKMGNITGVESVLKGATENIKAIKTVLDVSMNIPPEAVSLEHKILANYTLENFYHCRLQYQIDDKYTSGSTLDNTSSEFLQYMEDSATEYFNNNLDYISNFVGHLTA